MIKTGLVSIVVPCYNAARYVEESIRSLRTQTYTNIEIIAVNDGSTDETERLLDEQAATDPRVRVVTRPNGGPSAARNSGLQIADGEYIAFLDADDVYLPEKIEKQVAFLRANPAVDLVYSDNYDADSNLELIGLHIMRLPDLPAMDLWAQRNWFTPLVPLLRRQLVNRVGDFDEALRAAEDWDYWIRCARIGKFAYLRGPVSIYRYHSTQAHRGYDRMFRSGLQLINKQFRADPRLYRVALASFFETCAKHRWHLGHQVAAAGFVARSLYHGRIAKIRAALERPSVRPPAPGGDSLRVAN